MVGFSRGRPSAAVLEELDHGYEHRKEAWNRGGDPAWARGLLYVQKRAQKREEDTYTLSSGKTQLPKFGVTDPQTKEIDEITIQQPAGDAGPGAKVVLKKEKDEWKLAEPVVAKANTSNVDSLLENLKSLSLNEVISDATDAYAQYGVDDKSALHAVFNKGTEAIADLYFGHGGSRGQMVRIAGKTGVFGVKGYSSYLYTREAKQWRDMLLLKFDEAKVRSVEITNEHGAFTFAKSDEKDKKADDKDKKSTWTGKFHKGKAGVLAPIARFDSSKVDDVVRAYKDLNALDFPRTKARWTRVSKTRRPLSLSFSRTVRTRSSSSERTRMVRTVGWPPTAIPRPFRSARTRPTGLRQTWTSIRSPKRKRTKRRSKEMVEQAIEATDGLLAVPLLRTNGAGVGGSRSRGDPRYLPQPVPGTKLGGTEVAGMPYGLLAATDAT